MEARASLGKGVRTPMRKVFMVPIENGLRATKWKVVRAPMEKGFGVEAFWQRGVFGPCKIICTTPFPIGIATPFHIGIANPLHIGTTTPSP